MRKYMAGQTFVETTIIGRVVADPTVNNVGESQVCNLRVAVAHPFKKDAEGRPESIFVNLAAWNRGNYKLAQYAGEQAKKGGLIYAKASAPEARQFTRKDGTAGVSIEYRVDDLRFLDRKGVETASAGEPQLVANTDLEAEAASRTAPGDDIGGAMAGLEEPAVVEDANNDDVVFPG
jgi:single-stranded DNA-binding protein